MKKSSQTIEVRGEIVSPPECRAIGGGVFEVSYRFKLKLKSSRRKKKK
jgi:hypothetical protein